MLTAAGWAVKLNNMQIRFQHSPAETARMNTEELRAHFLVKSLMMPDEWRLTYSHYDRMIVGGAMPVAQKMTLPNPHALRAQFFLERREMGIINVGATAIITADGNSYQLEKYDCLYLGRGVREVTAESVDSQQPAMLYCLSAPAHQSHPVQLMKQAQASPVNMGSLETANQRTIFKYIHLEGLKSCQLVMGLTIIKPGSVWNTMPPHTHDRRMEAYFYFDVPDQQAVFHFMGEPQQTRHLLAGNNDAVLSPPWSIHAGCGTSHYSFIWGMAGENYVYTDMDAVAIPDIK